jgi:KRAB domain-containing zinc finger protein
LDVTRTEAAHFSKNDNAEELLGEQTAELSELPNEENFYSCEICKKSFPRINNLSGPASVSSKETMSRCEMCVKSITHKRSAMRRFRGREPSFSCSECNKSFTVRSNLDNHMRVHTEKPPFLAKCVRNGSLSSVT